MPGWGAANMELWRGSISVLPQSESEITMRLRLTGFLPESTGDDRVKFKFFINDSLEDSALAIMRWTHLEEALGGEQELTHDQAALFEKQLEEPRIADFTLFIGYVS